jgi:hypothetical protein
LDEVSEDIAGGAASKAPSSLYHGKDLEHFVDRKLKVVFCFLKVPLFVHSYSLIVKFFQRLEKRHDHVVV